MFRQIKEQGKLVDPFSPTKGVRENFKKVYKSTKHKVANEVGVRTRKQGIQRDVEEDMPDL